VICSIALVDLTNCNLDRLQSVINAAERHTVKTTSLRYLWTSRGCGYLSELLMFSCAFGNIELTPSASRGPSGKVFFKIQWLHLADVVVASYLPQISSGFSVAKIIYIGLILTELFKKILKWCCFDHVYTRIINSRPNWNGQY